MTWRVRFHDRNLVPNEQDSGAVVFAFWHGEQLPLIPLHASHKVVGLASLSRDGDLVANVLHRFGYTVIRGSGSRGGTEAYQACLHSLQSGISPALAVDGPRGPYHRVHYGAARLAMDSNRPIIFVACHASGAYRMSSWDRFMIPYPWAKIDIAYGRLQPQAGQSKELLSQALQTKMEDLSCALRRPSSFPLDD